MAEGKDCTTTKLDSEPIAVDSSGDLAPPAPHATTFKKAGGDPVSVGNVAPDERGRRAQVRPDASPTRHRVGHGSRPAAVRDRAVEALLTAPTLDVAAKAAGIDVSTLKRWLDEDEFAGRVEAARVQVFDAALGRVRDLAGAAVDAMEDVLTTASPAVRLAAAKTLLDLALHDRDVDAIVERLDEIERRHRARREPQRWTA